MGWGKFVLISVCGQDCSHRCVGGKFVLIGVCCGMFVLIGVWRANLFFLLAWVYVSAHMCGCNSVLLIGVVAILFLSQTRVQFISHRCGCNVVLMDVGTLLFSYVLVQFCSSHMCGHKVVLLLHE